jgi:hypothetical protein
MHILKQEHNSQDSASSFAHTTASTMTTRQRFPPRTDRPPELRQIPPAWTQRPSRTGFRDWEDRGQPAAQPHSGGAGGMAQRNEVRQETVGGGVEGHPPNTENDGPRQGASNTTFSPISLATQSPNFRADNDSAQPRIYNVPGPNGSFIRRPDDGRVSQRRLEYWRSNTLPGQTPVQPPSASHREDSTESTRFTVNHRLSRRRAIEQDPNLPRYDLNRSEDENDAIMAQHFGYSPVSPPLSTLECLTPNESLPFCRSPLQLCGGMGPALLSCSTCPSTHGWTDMCDDCY